MKRGLMKAGYKIDEITGRDWWLIFKTWSIQLSENGQDQRRRRKRKS